MVASENIFVFYMCDLWYFLKSIDTITTYYIIVFYLFKSHGFCKNTSLSSLQCPIFNYYILPNECLLLT